ncbi:MAG TPA: S1/P1 nuclease [Xanthomonadaceae bacterium]|nr:S1/P1 nuclease [Xanthomonadaceae bacterium]
MRRLLLCLLLVVPAMAGAWGPLGHRLVGDLAQAELTPAAQREVVRLLADEPEPSLAGVSIWADQLRDTDPARFKATARWHYANLAENGCDYQPLRDCKGGCVVGAIEDQTRLLADRSMPWQQRIDALKFVVHFIGDIHQPLHGGYARDRGGNRHQVNYRDKGDNLHWLWDSLLLDDLDQRAYLRKLQALPLVVPRPSSVLPPDAAGWVRESCSFVVAPGFYPASHVIDANYIAMSRPLAEERLRRAGARLAEVLNAALGGR